MAVTSEVKIMNSAGMKRSLLKVTHEILARNNGPETLALVGLQTRGIHLARRIAAMIKGIENVEVPVGILDATMYRDDFRVAMKQPKVKVTAISFEVDGTTIVLVDDVLYTGRTIRAALDAIMDFGRPHLVQLAVLIDRGCRELPICPDFVGKTVETQLLQEIRVRMVEVESDGIDEVSLVTLRQEGEE